MDRHTETIDAQNMITRLEKEIYLNVKNPNRSIKTQYAKVKKAIADLNLALDILNDMKFGDNNAE